VNSEGTSSTEQSVEKSFHTTIVIEFRDETFNLTYRKTVTHTTFLATGFIYHVIVFADVVDLSLVRDKKLHETCSA
jgi:hypothetical protein